MPDKDNFWETGIKQSTTIIFTFSLTGWVDKKADDG